MGTRSLPVTIAVFVAIICLAISSSLALASNSLSDAPPQPSPEPTGTPLPPLPSSLYGDVKFVAGDADDSPAGSIVGKMIVACSAGASLASTAVKTDSPTNGQPVYTINVPMQGMSDGASIALRLGACDGRMLRTMALRGASNVRADIHPPLIAAHDPVVAEASDASGATVAYTIPSTSDVVDAPGTSNCAPASGAIFPLGPTVVHCNAADSVSGAAKETSFTVSVVDTTPPATSITSSPAANTNSRSASFSFDGLDLVTAKANLVFECKLDTAAFASCTSPAGYADLPDGSHTFVVRAKDGAGNTDASPATYNWVVDTVAPVVSTTPDRPADRNGWYSHAVVVTFSGTDTAGSGIETCQSAVTYSGPDSDAASVSGTCTDKAGNVGTASFSLKYDATVPAITASATKGGSTPYTADTWTNQGVTVAFACTDGGSGVDTVTADQSLAAEGVTAAVPGNCNDKAGNSASASFGPVKIDQTAPTATAAATTLPNGANGWYKSNVTVHFTCADTGGSDVAICPADQVLDSEDAAVSSTAQTVTDDAGNTGTSNVVTVKIDKTAPTMTVPTDIMSQATGPSGAVVDYSALVSASDNLASSPVLVCTPPSGSTFPVGTTSVGCTGTDAAGNATTRTFDVVITLAMHTITLHPGWNLVSFSVVPVDSSIATVLASVANNYDLVYAWDGTWHMYDPANTHIGDLTTLSNTQGFWIHVTVPAGQTASLNVAGVLPAAPTPIALSTGWNLVAYPSAVARDLPGVLTTTPANAYSLVYQYDTVSGWSLYDPPPTPDWVSNLRRLNPGYGYWINAKQPATWSVAP